MSCFRFKKINLDTRKVNQPKLVLWWVLSAWLSFYVTVAGHAQTSTNAGANSVALIQKASAGQTSNSPPQHSVKPAVIACDTAWLFGVILILLIFALFYYLLCKIGWCGNKGNPPPQAPGNGDGDNGNIIFKNEVKSADISTAISTNLPVTVFYLQNGQVVSNSAGLVTSPLPPMLSVDGMPVPNGAEIDSTTPGITTPPSIGLWTETNAYSDSVLDPAHNYAVILNYSVLESTNLPNWNEVYTVESWVNNNPAVPLIASIYYTNGVPETTNWSQLFLNQYHQPTNIVVYGVLPSMNTVTNQPAVKPVKADLSLPSGGTPVSSAQFFKLVCNTNDIMTHWP